MLQAMAGYLRVGDPTWVVRRRMAVSTMLFCMAMIMVATLARIEVEIAKSVLSSAFLALTAIPSIYSLAAVVDDHSRRSAASSPAATVSGG